MEYMLIAFGLIVFAILYCLAFDFFYMALQRKIVRKNQEEWDKIKMELEEKGADYIEISDAYGEYIKVCGGCYPSM